MIDHSISQRYVKVLFNLDCIQGNLDRRLIDFESITNIFSHNPKLVKFLKTPHIPLSEKKKVLQNSLKERFDPAFIDFLSYLIQKRRLTHLELIGNEYKLCVDKHFNRWEVDITTAAPMNPDSTTKLVEKLEKKFQKKIHLNKKINPDIIGGAILVISNQILNWSVTGRLKKLKEHLIATQV